MKVLIGLFVLASLNVGNAMSVNKKVIQKYKLFLDDAEDELGRKIKATTGGTSKNHKDGALDIGTYANKFTKDEYKKVGKLALRHDLRLGDEENHLHVDKSHVQKGNIQPRVFLGKKDGWKAAPDSNYFVGEQKKQVESKGKYFFGNSKEIDDSGRTPQSEDQVNKQDSSIQKEDNMNGLPRTNKEEEEDKIDPLQKASKMTHDSPNVQDGPTSERKKLQTESRNVDNVMGAASTSQQKKANGEQPEVKDQFMEAIGFFLPAIAGGLIGGAIGGDAGASSGIKLGMEGASSFRQAKLNRDEFEQRKKMDDAKLAGRLTQKVDITPDFMIKDTMEPVFTKQNNTGGVDFIDAKGNVIDSKSVIGRQETMAGAREGRLGSQFKERMGFDRKKFNLEIQKLSEVSGKQQETVDGLIGVSKDIEEISRLSKDTVTGPVLGRLQSIGGVFGVGSSNFQQLKSRTGSLLANYVKSISGAQSSDKEAVRLQSIIPGVNDSKLEFDAKLTQLKKIQGANIEGFSLAVSTGQPLKKETIKKILEVLDKKDESKEEKQNTGFSRSDIDAMKAKIRAERSK